mgnify:FL=1
MAVGTVLSVFAWLTLLVNVITLLLIVVLVRRNISKSAVADTFGLVAGRVAVVITIAASLGSLYLSEVGDLVPCRWCWIQRIAMYPLAFVLLVGWFTGDRLVRRYAVPMAVFGLAASTWHYLLQQVGFLSDAKSCSLTTPCSVVYIEKFGFISIPWMAGSAFLLTVVLLTGFRSTESRIG